MLGVIWQFVSQFVNGAKLPNWVKALAIGILLGIQAMVFLEGSKRVTADLGKRLDDQTWLQAQTVLQQHAIRQDLQHASAMDSARALAVEREVEELRRTLDRRTKQGNRVHLDLWKAMGRSGSYQEVE
jgi:hypothetical protein